VSEGGCVKVDSTLGLLTAKLTINWDNFKKRISLKALGRAHVPLTKVF